MTEKDLKSLLDRVRTWLESLREKAAEVLLEIEALGGGGAYVLSDDERRGIERGLEDVRSVVSPRMRRWKRYLLGSSDEGALFAQCAGRSRRDILLYRRR